MIFSCHLIFYCRLQTGLTNKPKATVFVLYSTRNRRTLPMSRSTKVLHNFARELIAKRFISDVEFSSAFFVIPNEGYYDRDDNICGMISLFHENLEFFSSKSLRMMCKVAARELVNDFLKIKIDGLAEEDKIELLRIDKLIKSSWKNNQIEFEVLKRVAEMNDISIVLLSLVEGGFIVKNTEINDESEVVFMKYAYEHYERIYLVRQNDSKMKNHWSKVLKDHVVDVNRKVKDHDVNHKVVDVKDVHVHIHVHEHITSKKYVPPSLRREQSASHEWKSCGTQTWYPPAQQRKTRWKSW